MEKKYPIGGYAPGDYRHKACKTCGKRFNGDKKAWNCEPCGEKNAAEEKQFIATYGYEDLADYLNHNHGLNLLQSEMSDLIHFVHKFHPQAPTGARWVKANLDDKSSIPAAGCLDLFIKYDNGEQRVTGGRNLIIELLENGWLDVCWLDERAAGH
jgi:hypothetical protein